MSDPVAISDLPRLTQEQLLAVAEDSRLVVEESDNPWNSVGAVALFCAAVYHGLTALSPNTKPARIDTVRATADEFAQTIRHHMSITQEGSQQ